MTITRITGETLILRFFFTTEAIEGLESFQNYPCVNEADIIKE